MYYHTTISLYFVFFILLLVFEGKKVKVVEDKSLGLRCISQTLLSLIWAINVNIVSQKWLCVCFNLLKKKENKAQLLWRRSPGNRESRDNLPLVKQQTSQSPSAGQGGDDHCVTKQKNEQMTKIERKWSKLSLFSETKTFYSNTETFFPKRQFPILILSLFQLSNI